MLLENPFRIHFHSMMLDSFTRRYWYGQENQTPIAHAITRSACLNVPKVKPVNVVHPELPQFALLFDCI